MNRDKLLKFIPKPKNEDVILYDTSLKNLIDVDVFEEYSKLLPIFKEERKKYSTYVTNIKECEKALNTIYLFKTDWSEEDYLYNLQNEKKTYSTIYKPIKKIESNIEILQKKVKTIDSRIEMQITREKNAEQNKKDENDKNLNTNIEKLLKNKEIYAELIAEQKEIDENLKENESDFIILQGIIEDIKNGEHRCKFCGHKITNVSPNSNFYKRTVKNLEKNKKELERLLEKKDRNTEKVEKYDKKIKEIKATLRNYSNRASQDPSLYKKKSVEILRLEGIRDSMLNQIDDLKNKYDKDSTTKSKKFLDIKDKIEKYELSLENLTKIKSIKEEINKEMVGYNDTKTKLNEIVKKLNEYKSFLTIFFKIYEQKAAEFCGSDFKFKIFDFENFDLIEKFEVYYRNVKLENLKIDKQIQIKNYLLEKFVVF